MPKVSVVVPIYKVENYLIRCVNSILDQSLDDIEIVLVDDGSPDRCPQICDDFKKRYPQIIVVHKENGGVSSARNAGIKVASGEYIGFVDSDDDINPYMFEKLYKAAYENDADFVIGDYVRIMSDGTKQFVTKSIDGGIYTKEQIKSDIFPSLIMGKNIDYGPLLAVWQVLYKRVFIEKYHLEFDEAVRWSEDNIFSAIAGYHCQKLVYLKGEYLYHYRENQNSITTSYRQGAWDVYCTMNDHLENFFKYKTDFDWSNQLKLNIIYYAFVCINQEMKNSRKLSDEYIRIVKSDKLSIALKDVKVSGISWKFKSLLFILKHKMIGVLKIYNYYKKRTIF